jgi:hypothetical protein
MKAERNYLMASVFPMLRKLCELRGLTWGVVDFRWGITEKDMDEKQVLAEPLYRRALAIREQSYGPDHPEVANVLNNLATLLQNTNRPTDAEPIMRRTVEILLRFTAATGHLHPQLQLAHDGTDED